MIVEPIWNSVYYVINVYDCLIGLCSVGQLDCPILRIVYCIGLCSLCLVIGMGIVYCIGQVAGPKNLLTKSVSTFF